MATREMTLMEIHQTGLAALSRELGPVGMIRFLQLFESGYGDYTAERHQWLDELSVDDIVRRIEQRRGESGPASLNESP
jgi:hypothetical protein